MCGCDAVPAIMQIARDTIFHELITSPGEFCGVVRTDKRGMGSTGGFSPYCTYSSAMRKTPSPYEKWGMMPKPCLFDIQITGTR